MRFKDFRSSDGTEKYISLTSGHTFRIKNEWKKIPEFAWMDCYAGGCVSRDMVENMKIEDDVVDPKTLAILKSVANRKELIRNLIIKWYNDNEREKFDKQGRPIILNLTKELGFRVNKNERDEIWYKLQRELK